MKSMNFQLKSVDFNEIDRFHVDSGLKIHWFHQPKLYTSDLGLASSMVFLTKDQKSILILTVK